MQTFLSASDRVSLFFFFFQFYLHRAIVNKLHLISEIICRSRGNTALLPFKILHKLMSKCPIQVFMYLLQAAFLSLDFGKTLVNLASCYHNFSSKFS